MSEYRLRYTNPNKAPIIVKAYTANGPADPTDIGAGLYPNASNADSPLVLMGKGMFDYGEPVQTNMLRILENWANPQAPDQPVVGQFWYDSEDLVMSIWNGTDWDAITVNQAQSGDLDMNGYRIINLQNPSDDHDAVNLKYVNDRYAKLIGDTFIGPVYMNDRLFVSKELVVYNNSLVDMGYNRVRNVDTPIAANDAVTKQYADNMKSDIIDEVTNGLNDDRYALKAGDTFTGLVTFSQGLRVQKSITVDASVPVNMGGNRVQNVGTPTALADAVTKQYADNMKSDIIDQVTNGLNDDRYVRKTGDTMTGKLTMNNDIEISGSTRALRLTGQSRIIAAAGSDISIDFGTY